MVWYGIVWSYEPIISVSTQDNALHLRNNSSHWNGLVQLQMADTWSYLCQSFRYTRVMHFHGSGWLIHQEAFRTCSWIDVVLALLVCPSHSPPVHVTPQSSAWRHGMGFFDRSLMSALSPRGAAGADVVLELFETLAKSGLKPNSITYVSAIRAYGDKGDWERAEQVWFGSVVLRYTTGVQQLTLVMHVRLQLLRHSNRCPGYVEGPKFSAAVDCDLNSVALHLYLFGCSIWLRTSTGTQNPFLPRWQRDRSLAQSQIDAGMRMAVCEYRRWCREAGS